MKSSSFAYCNKMLCVEAVPVAEMAEAMGSAFYCTSEAQLHHNLRCLTSAFTGLAAQIHFEVKAKPNLTLLHSFAQAGAGAAIESVGELERAIESGVMPNQIVLTAPRKTRDDLIAALLAGISQITAHSLADLYMIDEVATVLERSAPVVLQLDLTEKASAEEAPGFALSSLAEALHFIAVRPFLSFKGLALASELFLHDHAALAQAYADLASVVTLLRSQNIVPVRLDLGSVPSSATVSFADQAALIHQTLAPLGCSLSLRAGARLVCEASLLVTRVLESREERAPCRLVLDAGTGDLLYPLLCSRTVFLTLRDSHVELALPRAVVGPMSEREDSFGAGHFLPSLQVGDWVALLQTETTQAPQAYGSPQIPEVMVSGARYAVIRRRVAVAEQMAWEMVPEWMVTGCAA